MIVYFDTNVFDHIFKGLGVTTSDQNALKLATKAGKISIVLSYLNLEEVLSAVLKSRTLALAQLRFILEVAEKGQFVKPANILLTDDTRCYAEGKPLIGPFIAMDPLIHSKLQTLVDATELTDELLGIITDAQKQKEEFVGAMKEADEEVSPYAKAFLRGNHGRPPVWRNYWDRLAENFAEGFATPHDLESCRIRGISGLLEVRSVRMAVGSSVSFAYAETFEKRTPQVGDSRDMQHAILSSAADIFVTHDNSLARLLARIPNVCFQVMDFHKLLSLIARKG